MTTTYQDTRDNIMYSEDIDLFDARDTAYSWHSGQRSALYSFAGTGCVIQDEDHRASLLGEVQECLDIVRGRLAAPPYSEDACDQLDALDNLYRAAEAIPARN